MCNALLRAWQSATSILIVACTTLRNLSELSWKAADLPPIVQYLRAIDMHVQYNNGEN